MGPCPEPRDPESGSPDPPTDWEAFSAARERFLRRVRPESARQPPSSPCPDRLPETWAPCAPSGADDGSGGG